MYRGGRLWDDIKESKRGILQAPLGPYNRYVTEAVNSDDAARSTCPLRVLSSTVLDLVFIMVHARPWTRLIHNGNRVVR